MKALLVFLFFISSVCGKEISISFDDAPNRDGAIFTGAERTKKTIESLKKAGVKRAAFYINPAKILTGTEKERLKNYARNGHLLGNHTFDHPHIHKVGPEKYIESIEKAHQVLKEYKGFKPWFRYTYLGRGRTIKTRDLVYSYLENNQYKDAYVTIDNFDWYMDLLLSKAIKEKKKINYKNLKKAYIEALYDSVLFYDHLAINLLGKSPKHVILLHENDLNALFVGDFILFLKKKGWKVITPEEAYREKVLSYKPQTTHNGDGRIAAIAKEKKYQGQIRDRYQNKIELEKLFKRYSVFE